MFIYLVKRVLPFILTLIFGIGVGSIFGGSSITTRTEVAPNFAPARTYKGCSSSRRSFDHSRRSQTEQTTPTRNEPNLTAH